MRREAPTNTQATMTTEIDTPRPIHSYHVTLGIDLVHNPSGQKVRTLHHGWDWARPQVNREELHAALDELLDSFGFKPNA